MCSWNSGILTFHQTLLSCCLQFLIVFQTRLHIDYISHTNSLFFFSEILPYCTLVHFIFFFRSQISTEAFLHMRYSGTDCALMCTAILKDNVPVNLNLQVFIVLLD